MYINEFDTNIYLTACLAQTYTHSELGTNLYLTVSLTQTYTSWLPWLKHIPHSEFDTNLYLTVSLMHTYTSQLPWLKPIPHSEFDIYTHSHTPSPNKKMTCFIHTLFHEICLYDDIHIKYS